MLKTAPAVFAVGKTYQIMAAVTVPALFSVRVGEQTYYDAANGIMCSLSEMHRVSVPMEALDKAGEYTVCVRPLIERKPYFTETAPEEMYTYAFHPVPQSGARAYHIADAHNRIEEPIRAARVFGDIDFLIFNGDVIDHSGDPSKFSNIYEICAALTGGAKPAVFSRGNHDMRGNFAEKFAEYTPNDRGNTYYTFRLGSIWGVVLDCGEDKPDHHPEYGYTVACHAFREQQTAFLKEAIARANEEYDAKGVATRIVVVHNPFTCTHPAPFDIEREIFDEWTNLLRTYIHPHVMICGHLHRLEILGSDNAPCMVVSGSKPGENYFAGCGYVFNGENVEVIFTDSNGEIL